MAAFLGYAERATEGAITKMMKCDIIEHYKNKISGRYEICDPGGFQPYLESELRKVEEKKKKRKNKRKT